MIICADLSKVFDGGAGIRKVNLRFSPGRVYGIIGANGAGKTTLLRCLEGLYRPSSGSVSFDGVPTSDDRSFGEKRKHISYLPNEEYLYPKLSCRENIVLSQILRNGSDRLSPETEDLIDYFEIRPYLDKPFGLCSTGMKKKVQIAAGLTGDIHTLIWDEPNDGLDILANIKMKALLGKYKQQGKTIILSSHVIEFLEHFIDTCVVIQDGTIMDERDRNGIASLQDHYLGIIYKGGGHDYRY
jgi:ABC-type multidrug transport system ATPase subunit